MANGNRSMEFWFRLVELAVIIILAFVAAPAWVEQRIDTKVEAEALVREKADIDLKADRKREIDMIMTKLNSIEDYIREHPQAGK